MGSCVPPAKCAGNLQSYSESAASNAVNSALQSLSADEGTWRSSYSAYPKPPSNPADPSLEKLAQEFWAAPPPPKPLPLWTSEDEDTRFFMLERLIAQNLSVEKIADGSLSVKWGTTSFITEMPPAPAARTPSNRPLNGAPPSKEAIEQVEGFANYLYSAVRDELGHDPARLQAIIDLVGVCLEGVGNVVYVGKALTFMPRPPQPRSLPTPRISTFPGGHAYFSGAIAALLFVVITKGHMSSSAGDLDYRTNAAKRLERMARRIADNRETAALHFQEDSEVGIRWGFEVMSKVLKEAKAAASAGSTVPGTLADLYSLVLRAA